ncbi:hypothetical protein PoB_002453800 [Plakobranchus ocellatus]|uniref:C-type lectin domain-containing protein n=1 Tax=Plakobranchus ocellatus TaxID=259542 RepID=A0AAV3ZUD0_9GAST|nr:hypothetical protein PoB_002453800 [Plakobranchus ocellatus]
MAHALRTRIVIALFVGMTFLENSIKANVSGIFNPCYFWPDSQYAGDGVCFKLRNSDGVGEIFQNASTACGDDINGSLAEVRSPYQKYTAGDMAKQHGPVWLGAKTESGKTNLVWETDQESVNVPIDWWAHQAAPQISEGQMSCLVINTESSLDIQSCDSAQHYICQIYVGNPCDVFLPGAEYYSNKCFLPIAESLTFEQARMLCESLDSTLVNSVTAALLSFLQKLAGWYLDSGADVWLGTNLLNPAIALDGSDAWLSKKTLSMTATAQAVCQKELTGEECDGVFISRRCLKLYISKVNWEEARTACEGTRSYLVEPKTEILSETVNKYLEDTTSMYPIRVNLSFFYKNIFPPSVYYPYHVRACC